MATRITEIVINLESKNIGVKFDILDDSGNVTGRSRHQKLTLSDEVIKQLHFELNNQLLNDLATMDHIPSHLLVSELHKVNEAKAMQDQIKTENAKIKDAHVEELKLIAEANDILTKTNTHLKEEFEKTKKEIDI